VYIKIGNNEQILTKGLNGRYSISVGAGGHIKREVTFGVGRYKLPKKGAAVLISSDGNIKEGIISDVVFNSSAGDRVFAERYPIFPTSYSILDVSNGEIFNYAVEHITTSTLSDTLVGVLGVQELGGYVDFYNKYIPNHGQSPDVVTSDY
jgi:hypothetical protein